MIELELVTALQKALDMNSVYYGIAPGTDQNTPPTFPLVTLLRINATWKDNSYCGVNLNSEYSLIQVDMYALSASEARKMARISRQTIAAFPQVPMLQGEVDYYEPDAKAWRVTATWEIPNTQF
jgi:hypothetical protein